MSDAFTSAPQLATDRLRGLEVDNNKAYFDRHRKDFDAAVVASARAFVVASADRPHRDRPQGVRWIDAVAGRV